jgi:acyl-CoA ligase (AMP-forming) (exosortase A-associated)
LTIGETTLTYSELWREISIAASGLNLIGLGRGERVAVYLDKSIETVTAMFGASAAGGVIVPVNPVLRSRQVMHILADCEAAVLVTSAVRFESLRGELEECRRLAHVVLVGGGIADDSGTHFRVSTWPELLTGVEDTTLVESGVIDIDMAAIFYTSGSTGRPKGVVLSHRNLVAGAESVSHYLHNDADDVILAALPLSFDAGFSQLTTGFHAGAHVVLMNYLLPGDVVRLCSKHGVTGLTCVPPLWIQLADQEWPAEATRSLRYFANTGGRMPKGTLVKLRALFPRAKPYLMYGLTEAFRSTYLEPSEVDRRPDSIGKAIPNAEIMVVRPDGSLCEPGEEGELVHRGALVARGYWNDPDGTAERFRPMSRQPSETGADIVVWSGDVVVRDKDGFLYFIGRHDEMIKTSGYRVSPTEIEEIVYETGLVRDAVALGIPDPILGQRIALVVSPAEGSNLEPDGLLVELKKQLPTYMVPREVVVKRDLPRSPNGKFDRTSLRLELTS